jgi:hypothetical protein
MWPALACTWLWLPSNGGKNGRYLMSCPFYVTSSSDGDPQFLKGLVESLHNTNPANLLGLPLS